MNTKTDGGPPNRQTDKQTKEREHIPSQSFKASHELTALPFRPLTIGWKYEDHIMKCDVYGKGIWFDRRNFLSILITYEDIQSQIISVGTLKS